MCCEAWKKSFHGSKHLGLPWNATLSSLSGETQPARLKTIQNVVLQRGAGAEHFFLFESTSRWSHKHPQAKARLTTSLSFHYFTAHLSKHRAACIRSQDLITVPAQKATFTLEILKIGRCISITSTDHNWRFHVLIEWGGRWSRSPEQSSCLNLRH